jgi:hypothetical protein
MYITQSSTPRLMTLMKHDTVEEARSKVDPTWKGIYKVGGICLFLAGIIFITVAILSMFLGPAPSSAEPYLKSLATNTVLAQINFGLYAFSDFLFLPVVLALYLSLKQINKNVMLIAAGLMTLYIIFDFGITELNSLTLVSLTQNYSTAINDLQRSTILASAAYALATLPLATFCSFIVSSVGLIIIGFVILRGVFSKPTGLLAITAGIEGTIGAFYGIFPSLAAFLVPALITYGLWAFFGGIRLFKLGRI